MPASIDLSIKLVVCLATSTPSDSPLFTPTGPRHGPGPAHGPATRLRHVPPPSPGSASSPGSRLGYLITSLGSGPSRLGSGPCDPADADSRQLTPLTAALRHVMRGRAHVMPAAGLRWPPAARHRITRSMRRWRAHGLGRLPVAIAEPPSSPQPVRPSAHRRTEQEDSGPSLRMRLSRAWLHAAPHCEADPATTMRLWAVVPLIGRHHGDHGSWNYVDHGTTWTPRRAPHSRRAPPAGMA